jgi:hypothetical protein
VLRIDGLPGESLSGTFEQRSKVQIPSKWLLQHHPPIPLSPINPVSGVRTGDHLDPTAPETEALLIALGFPLREAITADAFPKIPILIGSRAEHQRQGLGDIDSTFLLLNFFLDMEGDDFTKKKIMTS